MKRLAGLTAVLVAATSPLAAQDGAGTAGATILQLPAGSRAPALSGAYAAMSGDADALFYNPAGVANVAGAASLAYQRHVEDIGLISAAGAFRTGRLVFGASLLVLDFGDIAEIVPDDDFGGQTGRPTGNTVGASELAARASVALPLVEDRLHVGLTTGLVSTDLAGARRSAPFLDAGVQYLLPRVTVGASLRNLGGSMSGSGLADAPLPTELRAGAVVDVSGAQGLGALFAVDLVTSLEEGTTGVVGGVEAGLMPRGAGLLGAVGRIGYDTGPGEDGLGALRLGGGISLAGIAFDYTYQRYDFFGTIHRFGVRWNRLP
jgi:hypothetical protein